jgi:hypothetical protein
MIMNLFGSCCSMTPAPFRRNTKGAALPSIMGTSGPSSSTKALSIPKPKNDDVLYADILILDI